MASRLFRPIRFLKETDIAGVSRLPREKFPTVHVVSDSVGVTSDSPLSFDITIAFPLSGQGRPPQKDAPFSENTGEFNTQPSCTSAGTVRSMVGFAMTVARHHASLEAKATG